MSHPCSRSHFGLLSLAHTLALPRSPPPCLPQFHSHHVAAEGDPPAAPQPKSLPAVAWLGCRTTEPSCCRGCHHQLLSGCRCSCQPSVRVRRNLTERGSPFCRMRPQQLLPRRTPWVQAWCPAGPACRPQTAPWRRGGARWSLEQSVLLTILCICPYIA